MTQVGRSPCADPVIETYTSLSKTQTLHDLTTPAALRDHPGVRRFTEWVKDKPHGRA